MTGSGRSSSVIHEVKINRAQFWEVGELNLVHAHDQGRFHDAPELELTRGLGRCQARLPHACHRTAASCAVVVATNQNACYINPETQEKTRVVGSFFVWFLITSTNEEKCGNPGIPVPAKT